VECTEDAILTGIERAYFVFVGAAGFNNAAAEALITDVTPPDCA